MFYLNRLIVQKLFLDSSEFGIINGRVYAATIFSNYYYYQINEDMAFY